jgi:hypothetical protein
MNTFPIVRRKDMKKHRDYCAKRVIVGLKKTDPVSIRVSRNRL